MKNKLYLILILILFTACSNPQEDDPKLSLTQSHLGTDITITAYGESIAHANQSILAAFKEIERIDNLLSHTINTSEVYRLNKDSMIENYSDDLKINIQKSLYYGDISQGAFDITVLPILDLYTYTFTKLQRPPTDEEIKKELEKVNYEYIILTKDKITFRKPTKITLGGIAKGYAIDKAIETLQDNGIEYALVDAGGDIRALGDKDGEDWQIALENPRDKKDYITIIPLNNRSVVTSGDYERYFDEEMDYHHIIDPMTGYSATELISVTIIADKAIDADAISTAVFVLGPIKGLELIESLDDVEGLLITKDKKIIKSSGFKY